MYQDDSDRPHKKWKIILEGYRKVRFCGQIKIIGGFLYFCCMSSYPNNRKHFLRTDHRAILDSLDASQQNKFGSVRYSVTNTTFPNSMLNDNFDFSRDYINQFGRLIPYDFVNQVIPLIFKITGEEW